MNLKTGFKTIYFECFLPNRIFSKTMNKRQEVSNDILISDISTSPEINLHKQRKINNYLSYISYIGKINLFVECLLLTEQ